MPKLYAELAEWWPLMSAPGDTVRAEHDRHVEGLFARADWLRLLTEAGFDPRAVRFDHSELEPGSCEIYVAAKSACADA